MPKIVNSNGIIATGKK